MKKLASAIIALAFVPASVAFAQTSPQPSPMPKTTAPPAATAPQPDLTLTDAQAKNWINKTIYSSDNKKLGEVAAFTRDSSGKVTEMQADMGGFLGIGESRVRFTPAQFKLQNDRVVLNMTADQAKSLPKAAK